jgi:hypothetical protein
MRHAARKDHQVAGLDGMAATGELTVARALDAVAHDRRLDPTLGHVLVSRAREEADVARKQPGELGVPPRRALRGRRQSDPVARQVCRTLPMIGCEARSSFHPLIQLRSGLPPGCSRFQRWPSRGAKNIVDSSMSADLARFRRSA